jgi:uncharacterized LabA/DUF88 family protein
MFFDGSSLITQIRQLQGQGGRFKGHKLRPLDVVTYFDEAVITDGLGTVYKRAVFYFVKNYSQVEQFLELAGRTTPGLVRDVEFRFCGRKMSGSARYEEWLDTVPDEFRERCRRSEKGVDIEICCDALHLAAAKLMDRLLLLTNDSDFVPLCRMLKQLGTNVSLIRLSEARPVNEELVEACDTYDVMDERHLFTAFGLSAAV